MKKRLLAVTVIAASTALLAAGCSPSGGPDEGNQDSEPQELGISDADYSLDKLIEEAKKEDPIVVVDATGKIQDMAENFTEKYGIEATGVKMSASEQAEVIEREAAANNVKSDVFNMSNLPEVTSNFLPQGLGVSWLPPDLEDQIPAEYRSPAITSLNPWMWVYNNDKEDTCPVDNWWALTDADWKGKVSIPDPQLRNETMFWFNQIAENADDEMAQAYKDYFGKDLPDGTDSATELWVEKFAQNQPNVQKSDTDVGPVVGATDQTDPPMGFVSAAIFRDAENQGFALGACEGMEPWVGQLTPRVAVIASGTDSPNASKLFVHYMMSGEGMMPQAADGKIPSNTTVEMPDDEA